MSKKEIQILENQIEKLNVKDFDLEAWKKYTIILLARIFGDNSQKIRQVEHINYDYSSWSLRDTSGSSSYLETCKKLGREILEASIEELKIFGLPEHSENANELFDSINISLQDELKGSQYRELKQIIIDETDREKIREKILEALKSYGSEVSVEALASILSNSSVVKQFKN
jgi:hypothetical protein